MKIKSAIAKVVQGADLDEREMEETMMEIIDGQTTPAQIGALITALRIKGETVAEITGAARALRARADALNLNNHSVNLDRDEINIEEETILDTCGTGGDGTRTFNVSTATALVAAGAGVKVAKHGNRAVSSLCGSADVLEHLGVNLDLTRSDVERCLRELGIGFLYAPLFHSALKHAAGPRREIGLRTIFNLLGPLTNPAGASAQVMGVYAPELTEKLARVLDRLGTREAFVVCGEGALDEISICGPTRVSHLRDHRVRTFELTPEEVGFQRAPLEAIRGGDAAANARIIRSILAGEPGPKREMVLLNTAAAFRAVGLDDTFPDGIRRAAEAIDSGKAQMKLDQLIAFSQECRPFLRKAI
ncbi:MAG: anthranilate phosphoribosyltransferase [Deltaproteobacteria bacterium]|nr:anthranilate phosphoribosyltransferase [Deltaproteobacteria bacterium]